jgi:hypothetical protein
MPSVRVKKSCLLSSIISPPAIQPQPSADTANHALLNHGMGTTNYPPPIQSTTLHAPQPNAYGTGRINTHIQAQTWATSSQMRRRRRELPWNQEKPAASNALASTHANLDPEQSSSLQPTVHKVDELDADDSSGEEDDANHNADVVEHLNVIGGTKSFHSSGPL